MQKTFILLAATFALTACGEMGAPKCDSAEVKNQALKLTRQVLQSELIHQYLPKYITYEEAKKSDVEQFRNFAGMVDKQIAENGMTITGIRPMSEDGKIRKCTCAASIALNNGNTLGLDYSAQYTTDGQIYVEVRVK